MASISNDPFERELYQPGITVKYRLYPGKAGLEPVFFTHGWAGSAQDWLPLVDYYRKQGHPCLVFDAPGFGKSQFDTTLASHHAGYSIERYVSCMLALLNWVSKKSIQER